MFIITGSFANECLLFYLWLLIVLPVGTVPISIIVEINTYAVCQRKSTYNSLQTFMKHSTESILKTHQNVCVIPFVSCWELGIWLQLNQTYFSALHCIPRLMKHWFPNCNVVTWGWKYIKHHWLKCVDRVNWEWTKCLITTVKTVKIFLYPSNRPSSLPPSPVSVHVTHCNRS